jgi:hypothetical protein
MEEIHIVGNELDLEGLECIIHAIGSTKVIIAEQFYSSIFYLSLDVTYSEYFQ